MPRISHLFLCLLLLGLVGCASSRGELDLKVVSQANPAEGPVVRIGEVVDARKFELKPDRPSIPSLKNGEIDDPKIRARAVARKRNGYGKALGDILLPEGRTVSQVVSEVVTQGLRGAGVRVLEPGQEGYDAAPQVHVGIEEFWAWMNPGFWSISVECNIALVVRVPWSDAQITVLGHGLTKSGAAKTSVWQSAIDEGLRDAQTKMRVAFSPTGDASETSGGSAPVAAADP